MKVFKHFDLDSKNKAIIDIKNILISNLSYIHKNLKIDLDEEVQKVRFQSK